MLPVCGTCIVNWQKLFYMSFRKFLSYVPVLILALTLVYTVYTFNTSDLLITNKRYVAMVAVFLCLVFQITKPRIGRWMTLATLLAGCLNWLVFTPVNIIYGFSIGGIGPDVQGFSFLVLILFIIINFQSVKRHLKWLLQERSEGQA